MIRALVIDDDPDCRAVTTIALRLGRDFAIEAVASAREALAMLRDDCPRFDAVLVSTTTTEMDGVLIESIRQRPGCATVPIVFLARRIDPGARDRYRAMGAAEVMQVPIDPIEFPREIRTMVDRAQR